MNPFLFCRAQFSADHGGNMNHAAMTAVLTLMGSAYSSGFVRAPGNSEIDYCVREVASALGVDHPVSVLFKTHFADKLGR